MPFTLMRNKFCNIIMGVILGFSSLAATAGDFVVVLDPGHGGKDTGTVGKRVREKDVVLDVAKRVGKKLAADEGFKVVYTRDGDYFVTLQNRADIANKADADLFVSIHVNSLPLNRKGRENVQGASVYTLGLDKSSNNLSVAMQENSVMELESDYSARYHGFDPNSAESYIIFELDQNVHLQQSLDFASMAQNELVATAGRADRKIHQAGFWVLWATSKPAVLVELDFMCNPAVEAFLGSDDGREKCATALYNAISKYRGANSRTPTDALNSAPATSATTSKPVADVASTTEPAEAVKPPSKSYKLPEIKPDNDSGSSDSNNTPARKRRRMKTANDQRNAND